MKEYFELKFLSLDSSKHSPIGSCFLVTFALPAQTFSIGESVCCRKSPGPRKF